MASSTEEKKWLATWIGFPKKRSLNHVQTTMSKVQPRTAGTTFVKRNANMLWQHNKDRTDDLLVVTVRLTVTLELSLFFLFCYSFLLLPFSFCWRKETLAFFRCTNNDVYVMTARNRSCAGSVCWETSTECLSTFSLLCSKQRCFASVHIFGLFGNSDIQEIFDCQWFQCFLQTKQECYSCDINSLFWGRAECANFQPTSSVLSNLRKKGHLLFLLFFFSILLCLFTSLPFFFCFSCRHLQYCLLQQRVQVRGSCNSTSPPLYFQAFFSVKLLVSRHLFVWCFLFNFILFIYFVFVFFGFFFCCTNQGCDHLTSEPCSTTNQGNLLVTGLQTNKTFRNYLFTVTSMSCVPQTQIIFYSKKGQQFKDRTGFQSTPNETNLSSFKNLFAPITTRSLLSIRFFTHLFLGFTWDTRNTTAECFHPDLLLKRRHSLWHLVWHTRHSWCTGRWVVWVVKPWLRNLLRGIEKRQRQSCRLDLLQRRLTGSWPRHITWSMCVSFVYHVIIACMAFDAFGKGDLLVSTMTTTMTTTAVWLVQAASLAKAARLKNTDLISKHFETWHACHKFIRQQGSVYRYLFVETVSVW